MRSRKKIEKEVSEILRYPEYPNSQQVLGNLVMLETIIIELLLDIREGKR